MTHIIGGRQSILNQVPQELRTKYPRLNEPLNGEDVEDMLKQSILVLQDENMKGSHVVFCDFIRLILALQLSVAEANFK